MRVESLGFYHHHVEVALLLDGRVERLIPGHAVFRVQGVRVSSLRNKVFIRLV